MRAPNPHIIVHVNPSQTSFHILINAFLLIVGAGTVSHLAPVVCFVSTLNEANMKQDGVSSETKPQHYGLQYEYLEIFGAAERNNVLYTNQPRGIFRRYYLQIVEPRILNIGKIHADKRRSRMNQPIPINKTYPVVNICK